MQSILDVPAPAKLNLFLHITGRRADGYHLLQSAFVLIDWCDVLHFHKRADGVLSREDIGPALPEVDLCLRAAQALREATGTPQGVHIRIDKRIPSEAGMGGGSSDAASCLLALNRLWELGLGMSELARIGVRLGADVPFFLGGHNAWVEGIGEQITPLTLPAAQYLVAKPQQGLSTADIFGDPALKRDTAPAILSGFAANPSRYMSRFGRNDLQAVAQRLCPGITRALEWFTSLKLEGRMTGSGSAVFATALERFDTGIAPDGLQIQWCSGLDVHPLCGWAPSDRLSVGSVNYQPV